MHLAFVRHSAFDIVVRSRFMLGLTTLQSPSQKPESVEHKVKMPLLLGGGTNRSNRTRLAWNPKQPCFIGCFNWMIPILYIGNGCFTKHPLKNACFRYQVEVEIFAGILKNTSHLGGGVPSIKFVTCRA